MAAAVGRCSPAAAVGAAMESAAVAVAAHQHRRAPVTWFQ
jgi:hypothetical protein